MEELIKKMFAAINANTNAAIFTGNKEVVSKVCARVATQHALSVLAEVFTKANNSSDSGIEKASNLIKFIDEKMAELISELKNDGA